jgi:hypothetical protein
VDRTSLPVVNLATATYECTFGRGCDGICCRSGRPSVGPEEQAVIRENLGKILPRLRPEARAVVEAAGFVSRRTKLGRPMVRVAGGWCVFFNGGCVLHQVGVEDGDKYRYKPSQCALFPLEKEKGEWIIRQWGFRRETWDLFCLNPHATARPAAETLAEEVALAAALEARARGAVETAPAVG